MTQEAAVEGWRVDPENGSRLRPTVHPTWFSAMMRSVLVFYVDYPETFPHPMRGGVAIAQHNDGREQ